MGDFASFAGDLRVVDVIATSRQIFGLPALDGFGHCFHGRIGIRVGHGGAALQPGTPFLKITPGVGRHDRRRIDERRLLVEPPLIKQFAFRRSRRRRWLKETVRQRADAPHNHGSSGWSREEFSDQSDGIARNHESIGIEPVVEISVLRVPGAALREVEVPRQNSPLVAPPGIPVDIPVFAVHIYVADDRVGRKHVDATWNVDVVVEIIIQGCAR